MSEQEQSKPEDEKKIEDAKARAEATRASGEPAEHERTNGAGISHERTNGAGKH